ncbi:virB8 family protein [Volucribacter amazonae]|uniref:Conjugal transfer protein TraG n=1 Tax=Volucribacter amazonae TaxID=256731 RepID=A0A9X4PC34_9PAST|nr:type IV secretion system protein [Volucribacter amazonae]MDG6896373.1 conjugal transfer protein TraG [Volucribacter amazonae]MDG6896415.1 conjugal transfer protein TraG [Volucribacter amazonae]
MKLFNKNKQEILDQNYQESSEETNAKTKREASKRAKKHFESVNKFEKDRINFHKTMGKVGLVFGGLGLLIGLGSVIAVALLTPLKTVEPFAIRVDNNTGYTDIVKPLKNAEETSYGEELDKYWLARFVVERESYDWQLIQTSYDTVKLMTTPNLFSEYNSYITSPVSPVNIFKQSKKIKVQILSVSFINNVGQIRFSKQVVDSNGEADLNIPTTYWLATASFDYKHKIELEKDRRINPLGFQVTGYRVDSENLIKKDK